MLKANLSTWIK